MIDKATEMDISWPLDFGMTDGALEELLFPSDKSATDRRLPDYNYIRKELLRNGVTKKLLWIEYCEECRQAGEEPLMYSQFCEYICRDEQKRRATMHIPRKPGEQIEGHLELIFICNIQHTTQQRLLSPHGYRSSG